MKHALTNHLSKSDHTELLSLSHRAVTCAADTDLKPLVAELNNLIPFDNAVCAQGNLLELLNPNNNVPKIDVCDVSYPAGYLDLYFDHQFYYTDAVFLEFIANLSPVNWLDVDKKCDFNYPASVMAIDFNMNDGWAYGTLDVETMDCTAFFFGGPKADRNERCAKILEYIIPFYALAYDKVLNRKRRPIGILSPREIEVLNWIKEGKSSWEISQILHLSKRTIDFHIGNIKKKLGAVNRAQAVAIGLKYGIIMF